MKTRALNLLLTLCISSFCLPALAADVPAVLPRPDNTPPAAGKPIKVYIRSNKPLWTRARFNAASAPPA